MPTLNRTYHSFVKVEKPKTWGSVGDIKFYQSKYWRVIRAEVLRMEPLCRECKKEGKLTDARVVDHIKRRHDGGGEEFSNLQPLCHYCHNSKTGKSKTGKK